MVTFSITYQGDLRCELVHGPSGAKVVTDAPADNQGKGESFSPTDLAASSLGVCMLTIMGIAARKDGTRLEGTRVHVEKHMSTAPPRRIARIVVRFELPPGIPKERRAPLERAAHTCPVSLSLHPEVVQDVSFVYPD
jgi:putative redox protein